MKFKKNSTSVNFDVGGMMASVCYQLEDILGDINIQVVAQAALEAKEELKKILVDRFKETIIGKISNEELDSMIKDSAREFIKNNMCVR